VSKWLRYRFRASPVDYRPVVWPPPGPFWCTGYGGVDLDVDDDDEVPCGYSIVVAYFPGDKTETDLKVFWPEATEITKQEENEITFTTRFKKPDWWEG